MSAIIQKIRLKTVLWWDLLQVSERSIPIALLIICFLTYGIFVSSWGYYQDDWNFVYYARTGGIDALIEFMDFDGHPTTAWSYIFSFWLLGFNPVLWQIYSLALRCLAVLSFWWVINNIWPQQKHITFMTATIFAIYPVFYLQTQAVAYFEVWISFVFLFLSFYFSIEAIKKNNKFWLMIITSVIFKIAHSLTSEYTWGLELLRPFLLWFAIHDHNNLDVPFAQKVKNLSLLCIPHLAIFIGMLTWRGLVYNSPDIIRSEPSFFNQLIQNPLIAIPTLISNGLQDLIILMFSGWYKILQPSMLDLTVNSNLLIILFIASFVVIFWVYLLKMKGSNQATAIWTNQALLTGTAGLLFGLIPFYAAGYFIHEKIEPWNGRFALGSMPGIALLVVALLMFFVSTRKKQLLVFAILTGLTIGWQIRIGNQFRWAWDKQKDFYYQLKLRAPAIVPGTAIISEDEFLPFMGGYPTAFALNTLYAPENGSFIGSNYPDYWFFPLADFHTRLYDQLDGQPFSEKRAAVTFQGEPEGSIVISFAQQPGQCLWIYRPEHAALKTLSNTTRELSRISYVDRIKQAPENQDNFLLKYIYTNPKLDWCYFYEKADLAYQYEDWDQVIHLWETAKQNDLGPENGFEYLPFIEAYAWKGDWETTKKLTRASQKTMQGIEPLLCNIWAKLENETPDSLEREDAVTSIKDDLSCDQE